MAGAAADDAPPRTAIASETSFKAYLFIVGIHLEYCYIVILLLYYDLISSFDRIDDKWIVKVWSAIAMATARKYVRRYMIFIFISKKSIKNEDRNSFDSV